MKKRALSLLLCLMMVLTLMPVSAFALNTIRVDFVTNNYPSVRLSPTDNDGLQWMTIESGTSIPAAQIPIPYRFDTLDKSFDGWYTEKSGGEKITGETVFTKDTILYDRWIDAPVPDSQKIQKIKVNNMPIINGYTTLAYNNACTDSTAEHVAGGKSYTIYHGFNASGTEVSGSEVLDSTKDYSVKTSLYIDAGYYVTKDVSVSAKAGYLYSMKYFGDSMYSDDWFAGASRIDVIINLPAKTGIGSVVIDNPAIASGMTDIDYSNLPTSLSDSRVSCGSFSFYHGLNKSGSALAPGEVLDATQDYTALTVLSVSGTDYWDPNVRITAKNGNVCQIKYSGYDGWNLSAKNMEVYINMYGTETPTRAKHSVSVLGGKAEYQLSNGAWLETDTAEEGTVLRLTADTTDKVFSGWQFNVPVIINSGTYADKTMSIQMPSRDFTATANYEDAFAAQPQNGTVIVGSDYSVSWKLNRTPADDTYPALYEVSSSGQRAWKGWLITSDKSSAVISGNGKTAGTIETYCIGIDYDDVMYYSNTFTVTWQNAPTEYSITVNGGTAYCQRDAGADGSRPWLPVTKAVPGTVIRLVADINSSQVFDCWKFNRYVPNVADIAENRDITIQMVDGDLEATAYYVDVFASQPQSGTALIDRFGTPYKTEWTLNKTPGNGLYSDYLFRLFLVNEAGEKSFVRFTNPTSASVPSSGKTPGTTETYCVSVEFDGVQYFSDYFTVTWRDTKCTVHFEMGGHGEAIPDQVIEMYTESPLRPEDPTEDGWIFNGWYTDESYSTEFPFSGWFEDDVTAYAKWVAASAYVFTKQPVGGEVYHNVLYTAIWDVNFTPDSCRLQILSGTGNWEDLEGVNATATSVTVGPYYTGSSTYRLAARKDGTVIYSDPFTVTWGDVPFNVTVQVIGNGMATANPASAKERTQITLTATPDYGWHFKEWRLDTDRVTIRDNIFYMPAQNVTVTAVFEEDPHGDNWYLDDDGCLHITGAVTYAGTTSGSSPWDACKEQITAVVAEDGASIDNGAWLFYRCENLVDVDLKKLDTSAVTNMANMFRFCTALTALDVSSFDTTHVTNMQGMFSNCTVLSELNIQGMKTSNVENMSNLFSSCASLTKLDISHFNASKVTSINNMFNGCSALKELGTNSGLLAGTADQLIVLSDNWTNAQSGALYTDAADLQAIDGTVMLVKPEVVGEGWYLDGDGCLHINGAVANTGTGPWHLESNKIKAVVTHPGASIQDGSSLFSYCHNMVSADLSHLDTSNVKWLMAMFFDCTSLKEVNISGLDTSQVMYMISMFKGCSALTTVDFSGLDTSKVVCTDNMFNGCTNLVSLNLSSFNAEALNSNKVIDMFNGCNALEELGVNSGLLEKTADQLITLSGEWTDAETGKVYSSASSLQTILGTVTLLKGKVPIETVLLGDVDENGTVNMVDVSKAYGYVTGKLTESELNTKLADMNGDGKVRLQDVYAIYQIAHK